MSSGSAAIPLLKAAPEAAQVADRLSGGDWRGLELCLAPRHVETPGALEAAIAVGRRAADAGAVLTAECPVAWPSGAFVRVDRLDDEAKRGIEASARFAAADRRAGADDPPVRPDDAGGVPRPRRARRVGGRRLPRLLRRRLPRLGRHAADRERAARAADAHRRRVPDAGRRPLARPRRVVRAHRRGCGRPSTPPTRRCSSTSPPPTRRCSGSPTTASWRWSGGCGSSRA